MLVAGAVTLVVAATGCPRPASDPGKSATRLELAKDFLGKNELEAAEAEVDKSIAYLPTNEEAYNVRGLIHYLRAVGLQRLVELDACLTGVDAEALRTEMDEHLTRAQTDFVKASSLAPDFGEAWANRGVVANLLGDHDAAITALQSALANPARLVAPGLTRAHLGWAYFLKGDHVAAAKELRQALQFQPKMCVATYRLGRVYFAREEWEKAAEQFQDVSDQVACGPPARQEAALYLMKARIEQGLMEEARVARDACLSLAPESCAASQCRAQQI